MAMVAFLPPPPSNFSLGFSVVTFPVKSISQRVPAFYDNIAVSRKSRSNRRSFFVPGQESIFQHTEPKIFPRFFGVLSSASPESNFADVFRQRFIEVEVWGVENIEGDANLFALLQEPKPNKAEFLPIPLAGFEARYVEAAAKNVPFQRHLFSWLVAVGFLMDQSEFIMALPRGFSLSSSLLGEIFFKGDWRPSGLLRAVMQAAGCSVREAFLDSMLSNGGDVTLSGSVLVDVPSGGQSAAEMVRCSPALALALASEFGAPVLVYKQVWEETRVRLEDRLEGLRLPRYLLQQRAAVQDPPAAVEEPTEKSAFQDPLYVRAQEEREAMIAELVAMERYEEAAAVANAPKLDRHIVKEELDRAVAEERYEDAARLKERLEWLTECKQNPDLQGTYDPYLDADEWYRPAR